MYIERTIFALFAALLVGLVGYQIGVMQNVAAIAPAAAAPVAYYPYPYWHLGLGFFGFLFPLLFFFLFIGLLRAAFGGGRGWGGHGMRGWDDRRARLAELHRELHEEKSVGTEPRN